jgi:hypothetical protein
LGGLCENFESIHETDNEIRHKAIQTALSFLIIPSVLISLLQYSIQTFAYSLERASTRHKVAAVPWWEPESVAWEPETVNRKGL